MLIEKPPEQTPREELLAEVKKYTHHANYDGRFGTVSVAALLRALRALEVLAEPSTLNAANYREMLDSGRYRKALRARPRTKLMRGTPKYGRTN